MFTWRNADNNTEAGWTANNYTPECGFTNPIAYGEEHIGSINFGPFCFSTIRPAAGSAHVWKLVDDNNNYKFHAYYDGSLYWTSDPHAWKTVKSLDNWERYDTSDDSNGHFSGLQDCDTVSGGSCTDWNAWTQLECWTNTTNGVYNLDKISQNENYVRQTGADECQP